ncbi:MAG TPA: hypothetical protein VHT05_11980 [Candidatus Elarobacter sp.]|jgi:hypothetical protein|nr:hypothetical protein [Candidatus Elarobacter sp.]
MIELPSSTRRVSGTRLLDLCEPRGITAIVDPFMGLPMHLNVLKRHGIAVHGGDLLEWFVRTGEGLVVNDFTILRDNEVAAVVEMLPGRIYPTDLFRGWEGVFFSEEQCRYLGVWHANVHALRSDGQTGIAVAGLWHVLCHWLLKAHHPDAMIDIPPSELAWHHIREVQRWVTDNGKRNTVRRGDFTATLHNAKADAVYLALPGRAAAKRIDARIWMWEAWWTGNPYLNVERLYRETVFGSSTNDDASYDRATATVLDAAQNIPYVIIQTTARDANRFERLMRACRGTVELANLDLDEVYIIGTK